VSKWTKVQFELFATGSTTNGRIQFTTKKKGVFWLDQVSLMPMDTYKVRFVLFITLDIVIVKISFGTSNNCLRDFLLFVE
jgi:hypothetical protein